MVNISIPCQPDLEYGFKGELRWARARPNAFKPFCLSSDDGDSASEDQNSPLTCAEKDIGDAGRPSAGMIDYLKGRHTLTNGDVTSQTFACALLDPIFNASRSFEKLNFML